MKKKINSWIYPLVMIALLATITSSCKKDDPDPDIVPKLGLNYQGGIVFYLDGTGEHGLIAATVDQSSSVSWWNGSLISSLLTSTGATSTTDGSANTSAIIQTQGNNGSYAAKLCRDYEASGYKDWFLPSKDQLNILYTQKTLVGGFSNEIYWSSTEYDRGSAWVQYFLNGEQHLDNTSDAANVHTRAIRAF